MGQSCYVCGHHEDSHGYPNDDLSYCDQMKCECKGNLVTYEDGVQKELEILRAKVKELEGWKLGKCGHPLSVFYNVPFRGPEHKSCEICETQEDIEKISQECEEMEERLILVEKVVEAARILEEQHKKQQEQTKHLQELAAKARKEGKSMTHAIKPTVYDISKGVYAVLKALSEYDELVSSK